MAQWTRQQCQMLDKESKLDSEKMRGLGRPRYTFRLDLAINHVDLMST